MKQSASLVFALASAAPAMAGDAPPEIRLPPLEPGNGAQAAAIADARSGEAALAEGRAHLAASNAAQAISAFRLALSSDQNSVAAYNGLGIAYDRLGRSDLARRNFETALSLEPDAADVAYNLGYSLHLAGDPRAAVPWLQRASGGDDDRAAAAARRLLAVIAAQLEAAAIAGSAIPSADRAGSAPMRVASARIDMVSSGEAVLVLPSAVPHPAAQRPVLLAQAAPVLPPAISELPQASSETPQLAQPAPHLALSVPLHRLASASLDIAAPDLAALDVALPALGDDAVAAPALTVAAAALQPAAQPVVNGLMAGRLGALAALTVPLAVSAPMMAAAPPAASETAAPSSIIRVAARSAQSLGIWRGLARIAAPQRAEPAVAAEAMPQVITLGDTPPDFAALSPTPLLALAGEPAAPAPLQLLDLAALPLLATATPLAPLPLLSPPRIAVDWLAGTDIDHLAPEAAAPAYQRLVNALLAQADLSDAIDPQAVRMAINRLEALVSRIQTFSLEVMRA